MLQLGKLWEKVCKDTHKNLRKKTKKNINTKPIFLYKLGNCYIVKLPVEKKSFQR